jgi:TFIIF-interacting CTD phosphatase-like protein
MIKLPSEKEVESKKVNLIRDKRDEGKKTLIIDLDETLIHCDYEPIGFDDLEISISLDEDSSTTKSYLSIRPYALSFLKTMAQYYEIIAFTAS